jgi:Fe2+ transport system protein FeoA
MDAASAGPSVERRMVELGLVEDVSHEAVRSTLKKTGSSLTAESNG